MTIQQMFVALSCLFLTTQQIAAVVNNAKSASLEENTSKNASTTLTKPVDNQASATEQEAKRREAPILAISDTYGLPLSGGGIDSYVPTGPSNPSLPIPVYGVPDGPSNNVVYPAPPPDIPPPLPQISSNYGQPFSTYGPPQPLDSHGGVHIEDIVPPPPPPNYGPPLRQQKPFINHNFYHGPKPSRPRPQYGPPRKPVFVPKAPKPVYGPPKQVYGPPKQPLFVPQKNNFKQQSVTIVTIPNNYAVQNGHSSVGHFGPPDPVPHGPPHPGVPAPPTPPDIKYDGWQPIPGLVSRPHTETYAVNEEHHHGTANIHLNSDFVPPPLGSDHGSTGSLSVDYTPQNPGLSDSYGAPLNAVTGSGAIVTTSGDAHHQHDDHSLSLGLSAAGINSGPNHLSVIKSIGYELFPNNGGLNHIGDSYSSPPLSSYSPDGPYAAAHSHKTNGLSHHSFHELSSHGLSASSSGFGLIPPSGVYGAPPSSHYGTPLLTKPNTQYGAPLNALKINPPKHPVVFREPVPAGLIESIGQNTAHKDAHGIIESSHSLHSSGPTYIPPPVPELSKPVREEEPPEPSNLYSLPHANSALSFQNVAHDSSSFGFQSNHFGRGQTLTSYTAPLGSIDGSYGLPLHQGSGYSVALDSASHGGLTVGLDNNYPPLTIDLTSSTTNVGPTFTHVGQGLSQGYALQSVHDCSLHKSQPLPSLSYGVPSANSYTAALSSLTTNIGGAYQGPVPSVSYGSPDLQTAHSQKTSTGISVNSISTESKEKSYGKSLAQKFGPDSELIKSQTIDINSIPVKGSLGTYTLQIQPADGLGGSQQPSGEQVHHGQVLNDGLLQSILAAIEQPQKKDATILGRPLVQLQPNQDSEGQNSVKNLVVVPAPSTEDTSEEQESDTETPLRLIDNNEIALYFSNGEKNNTEVDGVRNGQQYGSYVSFKTPNSSFVYGNLSSGKEKQEKD